ncbi:rhomboid family intramembrane serine protease [Holzapfeliella sp. He02]|uniref:Rhomboid family intramembrane serine protease n=1 Tax=Holzapfeliella saturejae TaxID=3082953 RepID=A0ABU8SGU0_9LACO
MQKIKRFINSNLVVTYSLLGVMALVFVFECLSSRRLALFGSAIDSGTLLNFGSLFNPLVVIFNQWWRLITAQFIHINFLHFASNAVMIYYVSQLLEPTLGKLKYLSIFLLTGIGGNLMSLAFGSDMTVSAGASTSLFGLFGVVLALVWDNQTPAMTAIKQQFLALAILNLVMDLFISDINIQGHFGGLLFGVLFGIIFGGQKNQKLYATRWRIVAIFATIILTLILIGIGMQVSI